MMDTTADEQDLAKALDSVTSSVTGGSITPNPDHKLASPPSSAPSLDFPYGETPAVETPAPGSEPIVPLDSPIAPAAITPVEPVDQPLPSQDPQTPLDPVVDDGPLSSIKKDALLELRPLVDKLNVSAEEKFDTYLLLIRSTDDANLVGPAHEAAKAIEDETRRAEALLDIIKEIDYLSHPKTT